MTCGKSPELIATRYLILLAHLTLSITLLTSREENIKACLPYDFTPEEHRSKDVEMIVGLSLNIAFIAAELFTFGTGFSMFNSFSTVFSIMAHSIGSVTLAYFATDMWDCVLFWYMFAFCVCLPLILDLGSILVSYHAFDIKYK